MSAVRFTAVAIICLAFLEATFVAAQAPAAKGPEAPPPVAVDDPLYRGLDANLYMQTSAEYRACCYQAYGLATMRLRSAVAAAKAKAELKPKDGSQPAGDAKPTPLAIIMDLDETVLDNAGFQAMMLRSGLAYNDLLWTGWEFKYSKQLALVPGAKEFILEADKAGVEIFHISNRDDKFAPEAEQALTRLGVPPKSLDNLRFATTSSDKTDRRAKIEALYDVILYVGDNLRDFDEKFKTPTIPSPAADADLDAAIKARKDAVDASRTAFGDKWIILPNPAYGEWTRPLGRGKRDLDRLAPQSK